MNKYSVISFVFFTVLAALISFLRSSKGQRTTTTGFFLANRSNGFIIIGASLFFSNISSNQFIGENESVYINNMSVIGWGVSSVFAMLIVSEFFIPIYLKTGISTIPEFLEKRYDKGTNKLVSIVFLFSYIINLLPTVLYGGAIAFSAMFDISGYLHITYWQSIWIIVWLIGSMGAVYTIFGGFKAITTSDTVLSVCMFIVALVLPYFGLKYLGSGDWNQGLHILLSTKKEHLNSIGSAKDAVPFSTLFTGMLIVNLYYWGMEQYIVQQVIAGKSLKDSQKGIALACLAKLFCPLLINIPGLIAVHVYPSLNNTAEVFPLLVKDVLPTIFTGLTAAVLFGAAINTFNAGLNSCTTLFVLNLYKPLIEKNGTQVASEKRMLRTGRIFQICVSLFAMIFAPFIMFTSNGFYYYLQKVSAIFSLPIFTIMFLGFLTKRMPPIAAKVGLLFFITCYIISQFILNLPFHFLHCLAVIFIVTSGLMLLIGKYYPMDTPYVMELDNKVEIVPWKNRHYYSFVLLILMVLTFLIFSPVILA